MTVDTVGQCERISSYIRSPLAGLTFTPLIIPKSDRRRRKGRNTGQMFLFILYQKKSFYVKKNNLSCLSHAVCFVFILSSKSGEVSWCFRRTILLLKILLSVIARIADPGGFWPCRKNRTRPSRKKPVPTFEKNRIQLSKNNLDQNPI